jgi:hypothetical protein
MRHTLCDVDTSYANILGHGTRLLWVRGYLVDGLYKFQWKRVVTVLALALGVALIANWAVLTLFGQKSADRAEHSLVGIILLMAYMAILAEKKDGPLRGVGFFFLALIPCYLGTVFPDLDITLLGIGRHRNPLFHSSLSFFLLWVFVKPGNAVLHTLVAGYGVGLASHLWWDVLYYGDVRWLPGGFIDRVWLGVHGLLCLTTPGSGGSVRQRVRGGT